MISVDSVYRTVQAIMNKEQRGYLTPADFNFFGALVQKDIFEGYFKDLSHFGVSQKGQGMSEGYGNEQVNIKEKIDIFSTSATLSGSGNVFNVPSDFYRLNHVKYSDGTKTRMAEMIRKDKIDYINLSPLTAPKTTFPKYVRENNQVVMYPESITSGVSISYVRTPLTPLWASNNARIPTLEPSRSQNFELHSSEFYKVVYKLLLLAGVSTREGDIIQVAQSLLVDETNQEKQ